MQQLVRSPILYCALACAAQFACAPAALAWELAGSKRLSLHTRDGQEIALGQVVFEPRPDGRSAFQLKLDHPGFSDHFLSMREFKCLEGGGEVLCHVPYPYPNPAVVAPGDYAWLEHALIFFYKLPSDFGAKLWNGLIFHLQADGEGLSGQVQAIDLNSIGSPPGENAPPPFAADARWEIAPGTRWIERLSVR